MKINCEGVNVVARRVVVLAGGSSSEREVSLQSGSACAQALERLGHSVVFVDYSDFRTAISRILEAQPDVVFNALHGPLGEDGSVQGFLNLLGVPYTHSGVCASAVAMDKNLAKKVLGLAGIRTPDGVMVGAGDISGFSDVSVGMPFVVKPNSEGSSKGVFIVTTENGFQKAWDEAVEYSDEMLIEEFIPGEELTVTVLEGQPLGVTKLVPSGDFYDYGAKYTSGRTSHYFPADIPSDVYEMAMKMAVGAHHALGCRAISRADFRYDPERREDEWRGLFLLEVNTQPGMTELSLAPEQAAHSGISFDNFVQKLLDLATVD